MTDKLQYDDPTPPRDDDQVEALVVDLGCAEASGERPGKQGAHISGSFLRNLETGESAWVVGITPYDEGVKIDHVDALDSPILIDGRTLLNFIAKSGLLYKLYSESSTKNIEESLKIEDALADKFRRSMS